MSILSNLPPLFAGLHEEPDDEGTWNHCFQQFSRLFGPAQTGMVLRQGKGPDASIVFGAASDSEFIDAYRDEFLAMDPLASTVMQQRMLSSQGPVDFESLVDPQQFDKSDFYNLYWKQFDNLFHGLVAAIEVLPGWQANFCLLRQRGRPFDADHRKAMTILLRHSRTAMRSRLARSELRRIESTLSAATELFQDPLFMLDGEGRITRCNQRAQELIDIGRLGKRQGRLMIHVREGGDALAPLLRSRMRSGDLAHLTLPPFQSAPAALVELRRLSNPSAPDDPRYAVTVRTPESVAVSIDIAPVAVVFGLTPAETRIAQRLLDGLDAAAVAREQGIRPDTVRGHIQNMLSKTGSHRQVDLLLKLRLSLSA